MQHRPGAVTLDVVPRPGDDRGGFEQHAEVAESAVHLDQEVRRDPVALPGVAVMLLDAPLGVPTVAAHVPFADRTVWAGNGIGAAHDGDDEIAGGEPAAWRRLHHLAER